MLLEEDKVGSLTNANFHYLHTTLVIVTLHVANYSLAEKTDKLSMLIDI